MTQDELTNLLSELITRWENEVVEFKEGGAGFSTHDIGKYFSALANEANLRGEKCAWLVFGVHNKTRKIVGSAYDVSEATVNRPGGLKFQMSQGTEPTVCFNGIHELAVDGRKVIFFEIPAAPRGMPIAWKGHYYARSGENLVALGLDKLDTIRNQGHEEDWSAVPVVGAAEDDLDPVAIGKAREGFYEKNAIKFSREDVYGWDLRTFLDRARLTRNGVINRTTMLLVGKELSAQLLSPHPAQLVWKLIGEEQANEIFYPPFLLSTNALYSRIRNVQVRILPEGELVPKEVPKYVPNSILEALHNCIAHQDYRKNARIVVSEYVDRLVFENQGAFYDGKPEDYIAGNKTPSRYRNLQLVMAMREINMIDTQGYGIHRLYEEQRKRYFPMPDYETGRDFVKMTIYGHVVDPAYSSLLIKRSDLKLDEVCLLDRVQKGLRIDARSVAHLRREGLIEGRVPHLHISAKVAALTGQQASYMQKRQLTGRHYRQLIIDYLGKFPGASRKKLNEFLFDEIRGELSIEEKTVKISNLLTYLRRKGKIENRGTLKDSRWFLIDKQQENKNSQ